MTYFSVSGVANNQPQVLDNTDVALIDDELLKVCDRFTARMRRIALDSRSGGAEGPRPISENYYRKNGSKGHSTDR